MIVAAVINANDQITPIVDGEVLRLYNLQTKKYRDFINPATKLTEGRRGAALRFAEEHGATVFATPPGTFCELSYAKAKQDGIQFYKVNENTTFEAFQSLLENNLQLNHELPDKDIVPSYVPNV